MTQQQVAEALEAAGWPVKAQAVSGWERGEYRPQTWSQADALDKILQADGGVLRALGYVDPVPGPAPWDLLLENQRQATELLERIADRLDEIAPPD